MVRVRSSHARRGRTGRTVTHQHVRRKTQVRRHYHRRYAGIRGKTSTAAAAAHRRLAGVTTTKARPSKTGRHRRFLGRKKHVGPRAARGHAIHKALKGRHGKRAFHHRKFKGRKKSTHKRVMPKGLHRKFKGRQYHGRHVKPGQHRRFLGRKPSTHKRRISPPKPKAAPISSASYLSMF
jgi:hypothetical protein